MYRGAASRRYLGKKSSNLVYNRPAARGYERKPYLMDTTANHSSANRKTTGKRYSMPGQSGSRETTKNSVDVATSTRPCGAFGETTFCRRRK